MKLWIVDIEQYATGEMYMNVWCRYMVASLTKEKAIELVLEDVSYLREGLTSEIKVQEFKMPDEEKIISGHTN